MTARARARDPCDSGVYGPVQASSEHRVTSIVPRSRPLVSITYWALPQDAHTPAIRISTVTTPIDASRPNRSAATEVWRAEAARAGMAGVIWHGVAPSKPGVGVVGALRPLQTPDHQGLHRVGRPVHEVVELLALARREVLQHEVRDLHTARGTPDPEPHPVVLRPERLRHRLQPVVTVVPAAQLQPQDAVVDVQFVVDGHD